MTVLVGIGDFSRMTHLSVKALRHYHDVGLLEPAEIDSSSGYRFYDAGQVPLAQVIRRFRDLGMPIDEVKAMLAAPDVDTRNKVIVAHLERMEEQLADTRATVVSLRTMLEQPAGPAPVAFRTVGATPALAVRSVIDVGEFMAWWGDAFKELRAALADSAFVRAGADAALYSSEFFETERGEVVAFIPVHGPSTVAPAGLELIDVPAAELAVLLHEGPFEDLDRAYGALGTVVTARAIGVEGPIREQYLVGPFDSGDDSAYRTEVCWPVFRTGQTS